ncbi:hypothetical protein DMH08_02835 [Actinomadura sp. WAC 06369]|nr:hypothetical protein DMH08_02835 [Actinomadura sp. WAC 06369]
MRPPPRRRRPRRPSRRRGRRPRGRARACPGGPANRRAERSASRPRPADEPAGRLAGCGRSTVRAFLGNLP